MKLKLSILLLNILTFQLLNAHPHIFIDYNLEVNKEDINVSWTFDPVESKKFLYYFDDNGDGFLSEDEVNNLYNEAFKRIQKFGYFITIKKGEKQYPIEEINNFNAFLNDEGRLVYSFNFEVPEINDEVLTVTHFETSYYYYFSEPEKEMLNIPDGLYINIRKNKDTPYYYDPYAPADVVLDTSKPQPGWQKAYPTEIQISTTLIKNEFSFSFLSFKEKFMELQKDIYLSLSNYIFAIESGFSLELVVLLLLSLVYGIVHAAGPGHRKVVIGSYMLSKGDNKYKEGIVLSMLSALIHSGAGIIIVLIFYYIFNILVDGIELSNNIILNNFSSVVLMILVIVLIFRKLKPKKKECCNTDLKDKNRSEKALILLSSLIPCPGSATIMLVSASLGMIHIGIISVLFMSFGIGITLSIVSILSVKGKTMLSGLKGQKIIQSGIEWCAIGILFIFSITLFNTQGLY